jgi:hypothetical protein
MNQIIFDAYVRWYNWVARKTDGTFLYKWHSNTFIDFKVWHKCPNHPCHKAADAVKAIYEATGMLPKPEHRHLLGSQVLSEYNAKLN